MNYNSLSCQKLKPAAWLHFLNKAIYTNDHYTFYNYRQVFIQPGQILLQYRQNCSKTYSDKIVNLTNRPNQNRAIYLFSIPNTLHTIPMGLF